MRLKDLHLVLFVAGTLLIFISLAFPWWHFNYRESGYVNSKEVENFWLYRFEYDGGNEKHAFSYYDSECPYRRPMFIFERTLIVALIAGVLSILTLFAYFLRFLGILDLDHRFVIFIALLAVTSSFAAPAFINAALPKSWEDEYERRDEIPDPYYKKFDEPEIPYFGQKFQGTYKTTKGATEITYVTMEWGGGAGWYLALLGSSLLLVSLYLTYRNRQEIFNLPPAPYQHPVPDEL